MMRAQPQASHFIDGAYVEDPGGRPIESIYPATGEVIARVHSATPEIIDRASHRRQRRRRPGSDGPVERGRVRRRAR